MIEKYKGPVGSPDAMSALDREFQAAYWKASDALLAAVLEFEQTTGRSVTEIALEMVDVTSMHDQVARAIRHVRLHFLPKPSEVDW
jgi:hypothetical protein